MDRPVSGCGSVDAHARHDTTGARAMYVRTHAPYSARTSGCALRLSSVLTVTCSCALAKATSLEPMKSLFVCVGW